MEKTNVMRILDQKKIKYEMHEYPHTDGVVVDGENVAKLLNLDPSQVFKTLVTIGNDKKYYVCVIPVLKELDLKQAAKAFNVKSLEMIHVKDINQVTGYIRGGCSPIGMKKSYPTVIDSSALNYDKIIFSAGKIGYQVEMDPRLLKNIIRVDFTAIRRRAREVASAGAASLHL